MKKKVISILKDKENFYIFCFFLIFFPLKTQLQNGLMFIFDILFRNGVITDFFGYNYSGLFLGCEKIEQIKKMSIHFNWLQKHGIYYLQLLPSLIAFLILFVRWKRKINFHLLDWFLLIISCFSILDALHHLFNIIFLFKSLSVQQLIRIIPITLLFLSIGIFIFFKILTFKEKIQTITYGVFGFYGSYFLWMKFLGPKILPIIT